MLLEARMSTPARIQDQNRLDQLALMLARVFDQDPHFNWLVRQDARRGEALFHLFQLLLGDLAGEEGEVHVSADGMAVAVWYPPGAGYLPVWRLPTFLASYLPICGWAAFPSRGVGLQWMEFHRPRFPHYYLQVIGVDEEAQGRGHGRKLMESVLAVCDAKHLPVYLETSNPRNLGFYEIMGFRQKGSYYMPHGPQLWQLLRPPRVVAVAHEFDSPISD